jgi:hypothetical protein
MRNLDLRGLGTGLSERGENGRSSKGEMEGGVRGVKRGDGVEGAQGSKMGRRVGWVEGSKDWPKEGGGGGGDGQRRGRMGVAEKGGGRVKGALCHHLRAPDCL